jgi:PAT family beta-lactamase induction signal transducer AmpG
MQGTGKAPPVWLMGFCQAPLGVSGGLTLVTLPQLLAARHVPEPVIAGVETWSLIPLFCAFLLSPLIDWRFTRRFYAIVFALLSAALLFVSYLVLDNIPLLNLLCFLGGAAITLYVAAIGGWTGSIVAPEKKAALGAWMTAANIGAGGFTVMVAILLLRGPPFVVGDAILALLGILPLALFPFMPVVPPDRKLAGESFRAFFRDVFSLLKNPSVRLMLLFFALPSASFALTNILGGLGHDYGASEAFVGVVGGAGQLVAGVIGSLLMPLFLRHVPPKALYLGVGFAGALFTLLLIALPRTAPVYGLAVIGEAMFQAAAFAVGFAVILLEMGDSNPLAATFFAVINAAQMLPLAYMETVDGEAYGMAKTTGAYLADASISLVACAGLAVLLWVLARRRSAALAPAA